MTRCLILATGYFGLTHKTDKTTKMGIVIKKSKFVKHFDRSDDNKWGWLDKQFKDDNILDETILG
jgi:hypothetical protein